MIAEILIVTEQSEVLVRKIYRAEAKNYNGGQIFCKKLQDINKGYIEPHFVVDGVYFYYIHRGSLYFVATSISKVEQVMVTEFLSRLYHMVKDLCGVVTDESVQANSLVVFELLCDAMDGGYVQLVTTEKLRPYIQTSPLPVSKPPSTQEEVASRMFGIDSRVAPVSATHRPAVDSSGDRKEVFVDVWENMTAVTNWKGDVDRLKVEGAVRVKNSLQGHPTLKLALNEDLHICKPGQVKAYGRSAQLDHCSFHPCVETGEFDTRHILKMAPPQGQLSAMNYSVESSTVTFPVRIQIFIGDIEGSRDVSVTIRVGLNIPANCVAASMHITLPVPASVSSMSQQVKGPSESLTYKERKVLWKIRNMSSAEESIAQLRLISHSSQAITRKDIGPATVEFELSNFVLSGLKIRYLKISGGVPSATNQTFVRYLTKSDSFTVKTS